VRVLLARSRKSVLGKLLHTGGEREIYRERYRGRERDTGGEREIQGVSVKEGQIDTVSEREGWGKREGESVGTMIN
jgi:hypothetical protein